MAAAGVYAILPVLILTLAFQRRIEQGITAGALKG
jgi:ABC-type glycerol-3-phosphate transport system permease component